MVEVTVHSAQELRDYLLKYYPDDTYPKEGLVIHLKPLPPKGK